MHLHKSKFTIPKMDCSCEENPTRLKLDAEQLVMRLDFDLAKRPLIIIHSGDVVPIDKLLEELEFGSKLTSSSRYEQSMLTEESSL